MGIEKKRVTGQIAKYSRPKFTVLPEAHLWLAPLGSGLVVIGIRNEIEPKGKVQGSMCRLVTSTALARMLISIRFTKRWARHTENLHSGPGPGLNSVTAEL